jgi:eukaryotic-like serine/threonine-protein kinase
MHAVRAGVPTSHRDQLPPSSRYELLVKIASGGMATVYVGRLTSAAGITRLVAVKRAHAHLLEHPAFAKMVIDEARLASRIHHPNVVAVQDVEEIEGELLLVMDYVEGASLSELAGVQAMPALVGMRVILDACAGLHAAHELTGDDGMPLGIVHRDVSPHNILVGIDGVARLTDFGIAKSSSHTQSDGRTSTGALKGKVSYMAPEYIESGRLDARGDVFSLGVVAWETLTGRRLFRGETDIESLRMVLAAEVPSLDAPVLGPSVNAVIQGALARDPRARIATAAMFGEALETAAARDGARIGKHADVAAFLRGVAGSALEERRALVRRGGVAPSSRRALMRTETPTALDVRAREEATASAVFPERGITPSAAAATFEARDIAERPHRGRGAVWIVLGLAGLAITSGVVAIAVVGAKPRTSMAATMTSATLASAASIEPAPPPSAPPVTSAAPPAMSAPKAEPKTRRPSAPRPMKPAPAPAPSPSDPQDRAPPNPYGR